MHSIAVYVRTDAVFTVYLCITELCVCIFFVGFFSKRSKV